MPTNADVTINMLVYKIPQDSLLFITDQHGYFWCLKIMNDNIGPKMANPT